MKKRYRKATAVILCVSMVMSSISPSFAETIYGNFEEQNFDNKIAEQLKEDLGEEKAEQIVGIHEEKVEVYKSTIVSDGENNDEINKNNDLVELEEEIDEENELEKENAEEPEEDIAEVKNKKAEEIEDEEKVTDGEDEKENEWVSDNGNNDAKDIENKDNIENSADIEDVNEVVKDDNEVEKTDENDKDNNNGIVDDVNNDIDVENKIGDEDNINRNKEKVNDNDIDKTSDKVESKENIATESEVIEENIATESDAVENIDGVEGAIPSEFSDEFNIASLSDLLVGVEALEEKVASDSETEKQLFGANENHVYWYLTNSDTELHLSGTEPIAPEYVFGNNNYNWNSINYNGKEKIETVIFDGAATPSSCTEWFEGFNNLLTIENIELLDTSQVISMKEMFRNCINLTDLDLSNFNTSQVMDMSFMFFDCRSLTNLNLSNFDTSQVTDMSYMFSYCDNLTNLDLSSFNTSKVTNMEYMFRACKNITILDISSFDTSKVTNMSNMFLCDIDGPMLLCDMKLKEIVGIENINTEKVTNVSYMFAGCKELINLDLSNFNISQVTSMGGMFYGCSSLTALDLSNFNTSQVTDMGSMFCGCSSLTELDLSNFNISQVTSMSGMFSGCSKLTELDLSNFNTSQVTNMSYMFYDCSSLTDLDLSNFNTSQVTNMGSMFYNCNNLTSLDLSNFNIDQVTNISTLLYGCNRMSNIKITNSLSQIINNAGLKGDWKDVGTGIIYNYDNSAYKTTIPTGGGEYQRVNYYTVTFETNGGSLISSKTFNVGEYLYTSSYTPTKPGNSFVKWYTDSTLQTECPYSIQVNNDMTIYAKWNPITYTIGFNAMGGSTVSPQYKFYGELVTEPSPAPTKNNCIFGGWYKEISLENLYDFSTPVANNFNLYAKWLDDDRDVFTIDFDTDGGSSKPRAYVRDGEKIIKPTDVTKTGYKIENWYTSDSYTTIWDFDNDTVSTNMTLYAKWELIHYTIRLNPNGQSGTQTENEYAYNQNIELANPGFTSLTHELVGWSLSAGKNNAKKYNVNQNVSKLTSIDGTTVILYAKWQPYTFNIKYNGNGSTSGTMNMQCINMDEDTKLTANAFVKTNYTFISWNTKADGTGTSYSDKQTVKNLADKDEEITLYAQWKKNLPQYTITFNSNGGSSVTSIKIDKGSKITKPANPTKTGYTFSNWYKDTALTILWNFSTDTVTKNTTLYAKWTINKYTVTFNTNGGSKIANASIKYNAKVTKPANPTRKGYTFVNWYKDSSCKTVYDFASKVIKNTTIYAKWTPITYKVILKANGQTGADKTISCKYDTAVAISNSDNHFTSKTHNLSSWNTKADGKGTKYAEGASIKNLSATNGAKVYLYAQWTKAKWTVKYNANGGTGTMSNQSITVGTSTALTANKFKRTGYTFAGWSKTKTGKVAYKDKVKVNNLAAKNKSITLYAVWTENTYKVTYTLNGGKWKSGYKAPATRKYTKALTLPKAANLTKTGYTFAGWYTDSKFKTKVTSIAAKKGNMTVYAKWTENTYKVTYTVNGGKWKSGYTAPATRKYTKALTLPTATNITKTGYKFAGWYTDSKFKTKVTSIVAKKGNMTVYAKWTINNYTITYELNGGAWKSGYKPTTKVQYNKLLTVSAPTRKGYTFVGWFTDSTLKTAFKATAKITKNTKLYAKWKKK